MTNTNEPEWSAASQAVEAANSMIIVTHVSPDGDAIGAMLGLTNALRERGKSVDCAVDGGVPNYLSFLPGASSAQDKLKKGKWDLLISVDASDEERTGEVGDYARAHSQHTINLDHHPTNTFFGDIFLVMPNAVSATEVIYHWLTRLNHTLTADVATPLLTGLVTDTLGFRTSNVTPETLHIATQLMAAGAPLPDIMARTLESKSYRTVELWKPLH
jgi:phosphoesterase RecJ-like protein